MEISLFQIMFLLGNAAKTYIVYRLLGVFYAEQNQKNERWKVFLYVGYFAVNTAVALVNNPSPLMAGERMRYYTTDIHASDTVTLLMCVTEFAGILALTFFYERNIWKNILLSAGISVVFRETEAIVFWYVSETKSINPIDVEDIALFRLEISILLIYAIGFTVIGIYNLRKGVKKSFLYRLFVLLAPSVIGWFLFRLLTTVFYLVPMYNKEEAEAFFYQIPWYYMDENTMIMLFVACLWFFWLYDFIARSLSDTYEKILLKKENQYYESQLKNMEQTTAAWKKLRHDLKNHFIVLRGMLEAGEEKQAKGYLNEFIRNELGNKREVQTGNMAIDSILNYKILEAEQHAVVFDLDIQIPEQLSVSSQDMSIILGNAIDNAIEAAEETEEKEVSMVLQYTKGRLLLQIANPYIGELQIGTSGEYLTGKVEKENHGFGLKNIRDTVEKAGGVMNIEAREHRFILTILLYV